MRSDASSGGRSPRSRAIAQGGVAVDRGEPQALGAGFRRAEQALAAVKGNPGITASEIAEKIGINRTTSIVVTGLGPTVFGLFEDRSRVGGATASLSGRDPSPIVTTAMTVADARGWVRT